MASRRILKHTVRLYNYRGEVNDIATYEETILRDCYCPVNEGVGKGLHAKSSRDSTLLYLFDHKTTAESVAGIKKSYLPYSQWKSEPNKEAFWTLSDSGDDFFMIEGSTKRFSINGFSHKTTGSRRMWHFEVNAK